MRRRAALDRRPGYYTAVGAKAENTPLVWSAVQPSPALVSAGLPDAVEFRRRYRR
jgi:hypothetical protein